MKYIPRLLYLIILIWLIIGCTQKAPETRNSNIQFSEASLNDSIGKIDSLVNVYKVSNNNISQILSRKALLIAFRMNSEEALARAFLLIGISYYNNNNDSSLSYYSRALKIADKYNLENIKPRLQYSLAMIYRAAFDSRMSMIFLDSTIILAQKSKNYSLLSDAYNALGNLKFNQHDTVDSKLMYDSAYTIAGRHGHSKQMGIAMASLSRFEKNQKASFVMQKSAIEILKSKPGNEEETASVLCNLGTKSTNPDTAIMYYQSAINIAKSGYPTEVEIAAYNNLAYSFLEKKEFGKAEICLLDHAIPFAVRTENFDWLSTLYDSYTDVLIQEKRTEEALDYSRRALIARVTADKKQAASQVRLLAALLNVKNKELTIQTNEKNSQRIEKNHQREILWFTVSLLLILFVLFLVIWRFQRNRIRHRTEQFESVKRLIKLEEDRKGLVSMELHDLTSPFYMTMIQQIEEAEINDNKIVTKLKDNLAILSEGIRGISHRMNIGFIKDLTIKELVIGLCEDLGKTSTVPIHCSTGQNDFNLPEDIKIHIYRIIQEIMTNAIKNVSSGEITLSITQEAGMVIIYYKDSGPGFDKTNTGKIGLGISNIYERVKIIGGNAVLNTFPGQGTKWYISLPIKKTNKLKTKI